MKKLLFPLLCSVALVTSAASLAAQPAAKIMVVDMVKLFEAHHKTAETNARFQAEKDEATQTLNSMQVSLDALKAQYDAKGEQMKNPVLKDDVKAKTQAEMQAIAAELNNQLARGQNYRAQFESQLNGRIQSFRSVLLDEIGKVARDVAVKKGATMLFDKSGVTAIGMVGIIYSDPAYDITDEVAAEIAKTAPPPTAATPPAGGAPKAPAPAAPGATAAPGTPK